jgi:ABC-2 type transport system permease protein
MSAPETPLAESASTEARPAAPAAPVPGLLGATLAIARKELRILFLSPLAWVFLAAFLFLGGVFFHLGLAVSGEASMRPVLGNLAIVLLFCLPLVTMRTFSEETRVGTLELLMTAPIPLGALILGKWLATLALCGALLLLTLPYPAILFLYGTPDPGALFTAYLSLGLLCAAFSAAGLFVSSVARDQMVAGVGTVLLLLPFWLADAARDLLPDWLGPVLDRLSLLEHVRGFSRGVVDTADLVWFAGFTGVFLFLTWRSLESRRWR